MNTKITSLPMLLLLVFIAGCAPPISESEAIKVAETPFDIPSTNIPLLSESCPVTSIQNPAFIPPFPCPSEVPSTDQFWYGTAKLWTVLPQNGYWQGLPHSEAGYTQKIFWWSEDFNPSTESLPAFKVSALELDESNAPIMILTSQATNGSNASGSFIVTGLDIPSTGCWKITGQYKDNELNFVILVKE